MSRMMVCWFVGWRCRRRKGWKSGEAKRLFRQGNRGDSRTKGWGGQTGVMTLQEQQHLTIAQQPLQRRHKPYQQMPNTHHTTPHHDMPSHSLVTSSLAISNQPPHGTLRRASTSSELQVVMPAFWAISRPEK